MSRAAVPRTAHAMDRMGDGYFMPYTMPYDCKSYTFTCPSSAPDMRRVPEPSKHNDVMVCKESDGHIAVKSANKRQ